MISTIYQAKLLHVVDGDTIDVDADLLHGLHVNARIRLVGIDAPEAYGSTREYGEKATLALEGLLNNKGNGDLVLIHWKDLKDHDSFGRWLCNVQINTPNPIDASTWMMNQGYAVSWQRHLDGFEWNTQMTFPLELGFRG